MTGDQRWTWCMKYCKYWGIPPAQSWAWNRAEKALEEYLLNIETDGIDNENKESSN